MIAYLSRRAAQSLITILAVVIAVFMLARLTGDPTRLLLPTTASPEARELLRHKYGLDRPIPEQFWTYISNLFHGNMGVSIWQGRSVASVVFSQLPATLLLGSLVLAVSVPTAFALGIFSGVRPNGLAAGVVAALAAAAASVADFWVALILVWTFAFYLHLLPSGGGPSLEAAILPVATLALYPTGVLSQVVRASVERERLQDYVRAGRSRGLARARLVARYIVRNSLAPPVATIGTLAVSLFNGVVIVETVFGWPGIGQLTINAVENRDFPLLQGVVIVVAGITLLINLLVDILIAFLDPRVRLAGAR